MAAGSLFSVALCSDGTVVTWGLNTWGQLGNNSFARSPVPVAVVQSGVLLGKTVTAVSAGGYHILARCSDGTVAGWGYNGLGQLGDNQASGTYSPVPVAVVQSGVLLGKTVSAVSAGFLHSIALCSDGTVATWGGNNSGQLGNNSTVQSNVPVLVNTAGVLSGKTVTSVSGGYYHSLALCVDGTLAEWGDGTYGELGNGSTAQSNVPVAVSTAGLAVGERFVVAATGQASAHTLALVGIAEYAGLSDLTLSSGTLSPTFATGTYGYTAGVSNATPSITVTPTVNQIGATLKVNTVPVVSGIASGAIPLTVGLNTINVVVTAADAITQRTYTVVVNRAPLAASVRVLAWGYDGQGQLGDAGTVQETVPVPVVNTGALAGRTVIALAAGDLHSLALCSDGTLVAWGYNGDGELGNGSTTSSTVPVVVPLAGALAGKTVIAVSAGDYHSLALCSDGTVVGWGYNGFGELGNGSTTSSLVPVAVNTVGGVSALAGKTVTAVSAGAFFSLARCSDGTVVGWGYNGLGQLGNNSTAGSNVPVAVSTAGALAGKTVTAVAAGAYHSVALCSDGTVAAWGYNGQGQLGSGGGGSTVPVAVNGTGVLSGKVVTAVSAGRYQSLALCADSTLAAWGYNANGQLGNNSTASSPVPVLVDRTGVLLGKTVGSITSGFYHSLALCTDGTLAAWGDATYGELGNGSTVSSLVPVAVSTAALVAGESFAKVASGQSSTHTLALVGATVPQAPAVTTVAATSVTSTTATLNGTVNANGTSTAVSFDYGGVGYGTNVAGTPTPVTGSSPTAVAFSLTVLSPVTTYHFRVNGVSAAGTANGGDLTFTTPGTTPQTITFTNPGPHVVTDAPFALNASASPSGLPVSFSIVSGPATVSGNTLTITGVGSVTVRASQAGNATYDAAPNVNQTFTVTAVPPSGLSYSTNPATYLVNVPISNNTPSSGGGAVVSYSVSPSLPPGLSLNTGTGVISGTPTAITASAVYTVTATNGGGFTNAGVTIRVVSNDANLSNLVPDSGTLTPAFASATVSYTISVPNATSSISVTPTVNQAGATVKVNTVTVASGSPSGAMALSVGTNGINVVVTAQDGVTTKTYTVVVTRAALPSGARLLAWGYDSQGQLGINSTIGSPAPVAVDATGALAGKTLTAMSTGALHSLALCSDGTLIAWGYNGDGEFGNGSTTGSLVPVAIPLTGALVGKTVTAVAAGDYHSLALCSDGTVVGWGYNGYGQLGNNSNTSSLVPVAVDTTGVLAGKTVTAISAGSFSSVALCSDGTVVGWGYNGYGQLGNGTTGYSTVPVVVNAAGVLSGKTVTGVSAGAFHTLAVCSDGTAAAWGYSGQGQLGNNTTSYSTVPVAVSTAGVLAGKTVTAVSAGHYHSMARCSDGTVAAWGYNGYGQLGNNSTAQSNVPVVVSTAGVLSGKTVSTIAAGYYHSVALCSDGTLAAWGDGTYGELGTNSTASSLVPVAVSTAGLAAGEHFAKVATGQSAVHTLALTVP